jgi:hypothetical protein
MDTRSISKLGYKAGEGTRDTFCDTLVGSWAGRAKSFLVVGESDLAPLCVVATKYSRQ